jgi:hypothetical protein
VVAGTCALLVVGLLALAACGGEERSAAGADVVRALPEPAPVAASPTTTAAPTTSAPPLPLPPWELPAPSGLRQLVLTRDDHDTTEWTRTATGLHAAAPATNVGTNTRTVLVPDATPSTDQGACLSARHEGTPTQQGIVLRLHLDAARSTAVSVTKNVFADLDWIYNVTAWDSTVQPPFQKLAGFDMSGSTLSLGPLTPGVEPRLCARVRGTTFELKVWPQDQPEPPWGDPIATRTVELPPEVGVSAGVPGWYLGHLPPGGWADYDAATTWVEPAS